MKNDDIPNATPAAILAKLVAQQDDIDNLAVMFSFKNNSSKTDHVIALGMTDHTPTSWFLGGLEWFRWYLYDVMSSLKAQMDLKHALENAVTNDESLGAIFDKIEKDRRDLN